MSPEVVSTIALCVSMASAVWSFISYRLNGARVKIEMQLGFLTEYQLTRWKWPLPRRRPQATGSFAPDSWHVEVAVMSIVNAGRTAITIDSPALLLRTPGRWIEPRRTIAPRAYEFRDCRTESRIRLDPFDRVDVLLDLHTILQRRTKDGGKLVLRGTVDVAGRRPVKSSWSKRWVIPEGQTRVLGPSPASAEQVAYRTAFITGSQDHAAHIAGQVRRLKAKDELDVNNLQKLRDEFLPIGALLLFRVEEALADAGYLIKKDPDSS